MISEYAFPFSELDILPSDVEEILGFEAGETPEPFPELIEKGLQEVPEYCDIRGGIKVFENIELNKDKGTLKIGNQLFLPAKIVTIQLKNASAAALFVCTAGEGITTLAKKTEAEGDMVFSYILDSIGSVIAEKAMDKIQEDLKSEIQKKGLGITDRFSPGYCEWNVSEQQKLFGLLPFGFCNIELSASSLMRPIKSVSGIIGIGEGLKQKGYQCYWCNDPNCIVGRTKRKKPRKKIG